MMSDLAREHGLTVTRRRTAEEHLSSGGPYANLLSDLVESAKSKGASDIHIEPHEFGVNLRLRVDGNLVLYKNVGIHHRESLILEVKRIFGLAIGISGRPQDGRTSLPSLKLDLRVNLIPTLFGEKIVMRLLDLSTSFDLSDMGFLEKERELFEQTLRLDNGVVVISGPTGSGKTRTLYGLLRAIDPTRFNIITLEDPIEYRVEGLNQVQVSNKMTFADALRSVLRQDPDVILVGEVRDAETAKLCFQAAETGHLVFTTVHANGAIEVIERLLGLGVEREILKSNLRFSIAQRLEQRVCTRCGILAGQEIQEKWQAPVRTRNSRGCSYCVGGIRGRLPILEWASVETPKGEEVIKIQQTLHEARRFRILRGEVDYLEAAHEI